MCLTDSPALEYICNHMRGFMATYACLFHVKQTSPRVRTIQARAIARHNQSLILSRTLALSFRQEADLFHDPFGSLAQKLRKLPPMTSAAYIQPI